MISGGVPRLRSQLSHRTRDSGLGKTSTRLPALPQTAQSTHGELRSPVAAGVAMGSPPNSNNGCKHDYGNPAAWQALVEGAASAAGTPTPLQSAAVEKLGSSASTRAAAAFASASRPSPASAAA